MDCVYYVHYLDSNGNQRSAGPYTTLRETEVASRTVEGQGGKNVTVVRDRGYGLTWQELDDF